MECGERLTVCTVKSASTRGPWKGAAGMGVRRSKDIVKAQTEIEYLHALFALRNGPDGTLQGAGTEALALYELMHQLTQRNSLTLENRRIPFVPFPPKPEPSRSDVFRWGVWSAALQRHSEELRDWTWSGYRYLQSLYPKHRLETTTRGASVVYFYRESGTAITAGAIEVGPMLQMVVRDEIAQMVLVLGVGTWRADESGPPRRPFVDVSVFTFDVRAHAALEAFFEKRDQAVRAAERG
jgi:hypothetical protein